MNYKVIALILFTAAFLYDLFLHIVEYGSKNNKIPENVRDIYDAETYEKWKAYHIETCGVVIVYTVVSFVIYFALIAFDVFPLFVFSDNAYASAITVILFGLTLDAVVDGIFNYIYSMKIDEKYGFNKMTFKTFLLDTVKSYVISTALMIGLLSLFILIYESLGDLIIVVFSAILFAVLLGISFLYPIFSKIFNKFTPLEEGELRERLTALLEKHGYHVREIQVMDASKRTTKANAYFSGFGKMKTIVLYDTLIETLTTDEIVAVFAHELGHGLHRDVLKGNILSLLQVILIVLMAWLTVRTTAIYPDFGFETTNYALALLLVMRIELPVISPLIGLASSAHSRRAEYRADENAVREGCGEALITSLKKMSRDSLSDLSPSKIEVALTYSHPPLSARIASIEAKMAEK